MTEIGPQLRALIIHARKDPVRWGKPKGLSQAELAGKAGTSQVWLRQIETGYTHTAKADTLGNILSVCGVEPDLLRALGYQDVADSITASKLLAGETVNLFPDSEEEETEQHLRNTPGLTDQQKTLLIEALETIRREEPFGHDIWRRRKKR